MADTTMIPFFCPWCGAFQQHGVHKSAVLEVICDGGLSRMVFGDVYKWCKKPIRLEIDKKGNLKSSTRVFDSKNLKQEERKTTDSPSINIHNVYGNIAVGDNAAMSTSIYNETIKMINAAKLVSDENKKQAKSILEHVKNHAPPFLPVIADVIKKTLGL